MNKPKRPCGIYNLFYQLERELLIQSPNSCFDHLHHRKKAPAKNYETCNSRFITIPEADDADHRPPRYRHLVLASDWFKSGRRVRKHCKTKDNLPEKLGFEGLNKVISEKWKTVDEETKRYLKVISDQEWELYRKELKVYKKNRDELVKIMTAKVSGAKVEGGMILGKTMKRQGNKNQTSNEIPTMENMSISTASKSEQQLQRKVQSPVGGLSTSFLCGEAPPIPPVSFFVDPKEVSSANCNAASLFIPIRERDDANSFVQSRVGCAHSTTSYLPWPRGKIESCGDQSGLCQITTLRSHRGLANISANFRAHIAKAHYKHQYQQQHNWMNSEILNPNSVILDHTFPNQNLINSLNDRLLMFSTGGSGFPQTQCHQVTFYSDNNGCFENEPTTHSENDHIISESGGSEQHNDCFPSFHPVPEDILLQQTLSERLECLSQMDNRIDGLLHDFSQLEQNTSFFDHASC